MNYYFRWDNSKANVAKHKISFEEAISIFKDPFALTIFDVEHGDYEERWITLGMNMNGTILVVCHTVNSSSENDIHIRIYSARKATKRERMQYEEKNEMKKEYDFSKGTRGKFYDPHSELNLPIYLDDENLVFVKKIAKKRKVDVSTAVNELIRVDKAFVETARI